MNLLTHRAFRRVILFQALFVFAVLIVTGFGAKYYFKHRYLSLIEKHMDDLIASIGNDIPQEITETWCKNMSRGTQFRLTLISAVSGVIICDSTIDPKLYPSLTERPEVQSVLQSTSNFGKAIRHSPTLGDDVFYATHLITERKIIVRAGAKLSDLNQTLLVFDRSLLVFTLVLGIGLLIVVIVTGRNVLIPAADRVVQATTQHWREDFVANVSHELKTPLTSIKGFAETLHLDFQEGRKIEGEFLEIILKDSDKLLKLINNLLELSSMDSEALSVEPASVSTKTVTETVAASFQELLRKKSQTLKLEIQTPTVFADEMRLEQILTNLLSNAFKYTPSGGEITLRWRDTNDHTVLEVEDTGVGIAEEHLPRLFERFYRVDSSRSRRDEDPGGTGLGLSIVKHLMKQHGGNVEVRSKKGHGTTFSCSFPKI